MHWGVPEGSYASEPDGPARVREFRGMVAALHRRGLRVVLDVVYNHTFHSARDGAPPARLRMFGLIVRSPCCNGAGRGLQPHLPLRARWCPARPPPHV